MKVSRSGWTIDPKVTKSEVCSHDQSRDVRISSCHLRDGKETCWVNMSMTANRRLGQLPHDLGIPMTYRRRTSCPPWLLLFRSI